MSLRFAADGSLLASGDAHGMVLLWEMASGNKTIVVEKNMKGPPPAIAFSPDATILAIGLPDNTILIWDIAARAARRYLHGHGYVHGRPGVGGTLVGWGSALAFSPDGATLISGADDGKVYRWDMATGAKTLVLAEEGAIIRSVSFSADGSLLAIGYRSWKMRGDVFKILRASDGTIHITIEREFDSIGWLAQSGRQLVTHRFAEILIFDIATARPTRTFRGLCETVRAIDISPDESILVAGSGPSSKLSGLLEVWDVASGAKCEELWAHSGGICSLAISGDGKWLATGGMCDGAIGIWDLKSFCGKADSNEIKR